MTGEPRRTILVGWISVAVAVSLTILVYFELRSGELLGSHSNGITVSQNPIAFYVCIAIQVIIIFISSFSAYSILLLKK